MIFHESVPNIDRERISQALIDIKKFGDRFQSETARFIENSELGIFLDVAEIVGGSGSVQLNSDRRARRAVDRGGLSMTDAAKYIRLNIARETIDTGGQRGIEGTIVHEGKHARDFALMLSTFSNDGQSAVFNPTAYQREYSAHLTSAFYLLRRGGEYTEEGISLGILFEYNGRVKVNRKGIRSRLRNNYGLTAQTPGGLLNECANPKIGSPRRKFLGIF